MGVVDNLLGFVVIVLGPSDLFNEVGEVGLDGDVLYPGLQVGVEVLEILNELTQ